MLLALRLVDVLEGMMRSVRVLAEPSRDANDLPYLLVTPEYARTVSGRLMEIVSEDARLDEEFRFVLFLADGTGLLAGSRVDCATPEEDFAVSVYHTPQGWLPHAGCHATERLADVATEEDVLRALNTAFQVKSWTGMRMRAEAGYTRLVFDAVPTLARHSFDPRR